MCERSHEHDNAQIQLRTVGNTHVAQFQCWRAITANIPKSVEIVKLADETPERETLDTYLSICKEKHTNEHAFEGDVVEEESPTLNCFEDPDTELHFVRAPMKMGKTKSLLKFIATNCTSSDRIAIVSFRKVFTRDFVRKFNEALRDKDITISNYEDIKGEIDFNDNVVIQYESLF